MPLKYHNKKDEHIVTTLRIKKRQRYKLGMLQNGNESLNEALERILDKELARATITCK